MDPYKKQFLSTNELANLYRIKPDSIRRSLCVNGHWLGMRPLKAENGRLLWSADESVGKLKTGQAGGER